MGAQCMCGSDCCRPAMGTAPREPRFVKKFMPRWAREWARVLRAGGILAIVTICSGFCETQVLKPLERMGVLQLEGSRQFDNKGYTQCRLYIARRLSADVPSSRSERCVGQ